MTSMSRRDWCRTVAVTSAELGAAAALAGCCPPLFEEGARWRNAVDSRRITPARIASPSTLAEVVTVVRDSEARGLSVRAVGSGHTFSDVTLSPGTMVTPGCLGGFLELDRASLKEAHRGDPALVRVKSGTTLAEINDELYDRGRALPNLGSYDGQTIVGAASNATHGSGIAYEPLCAAIASLQMVSTGGAILQIEPTDGITAPTPDGRITIDDGEPHRAELIQDDTTFRAALVSLGSMGVIYAVVLRTVPFYWITQTKKLTTWSELKRPGGFIERLLAGQPLAAPGEAEPDNYEILVNPYPVKEGQHRAILTERVRTTIEPPRVPHGATTHYLVNLATAIVGGDGTIIAMKMNQNPEKTPGAIDLALSALKEKGYVDRGYRVFNLGPANHYRAFGIELAFPLRDIVAAVERVFHVAHQQYDQHKRRLPTPISLRFVKQTPALLAPQNGRDSLMIEITSLLEMFESFAMLRSLQLDLHRELGARMHWGLDLDFFTRAEQVRALYPETFPQWLEVYQRLNAKGTFNGLTTERLGISMPM